MKKLMAIFLFFAAALALCACGGEESVQSERLFDYQEQIRCIEGTVTEGADTYDVKLYFKKVGEDSVCRRIEYYAPESVAGLVFSLEGGKITAELSGIIMSNTFFSEEDVFRFSKLLCLSEEDVYSIEEGEGETTVALGKGEGYAFRVVTDKEGMPTEISCESTDGSCAISVKGIEMFEEQGSEK